jgi:hypothetical protein
MMFNYKMKKWLLRAISIVLIVFPFTFAPPKYASFDSIKNFFMFFGGSLIVLLGAYTWKKSNDLR